MSRQNCPKLPRQFLKDQRGGTAILFALALIPLLLFVGAAVDYARATKTRTLLVAAADAAALIAAKTTGEALQTQLFSGKEKQGAVEKGKAAAVAAFKSVAASNSLAVADPQIAISPTWNGVTAKVEFDHLSKNVFAAVVSKETINLRGSSSATYSFSPYIDIYVLLDISNSMGLGATAAAQQQMQEKIGCVFGCHVAGSTGYETTRKLGIPMRIDVLRDAVHKMVETGIKTTAGLKQNPLRIGVYTFSNSFDKLAPISDNLKSAQKKISDVELSSIGGGTNFHVALKSLKDQIKQVGDGSSPSKPRAFVFLITDGVEDSAKWSGTEWVWDSSTMAPYGPDWGVRPLQASMCQPFKDEGITVSVLYTTYVTFNPITESREQNLNANVIPKIPNALKACASGQGNFLQADQPGEIEAAVQLMFSNATSPLRISQ